MHNKFYAYPRCSCPDGGWSSQCDKPGHSERARDERAREAERATAAERQDDGNYCCLPDSGQCCGLGSWCCSRAGRHSHE